MASHDLHPSTFRGHLIAMMLKAAGGLTWPFGHFGFFRIARTLSKVTEPGQICDHTFEPGCVFSFSLADYYWSRNLGIGYRYEPEVEKLFEFIGDRPYALLDCGANYGYWSVFATRPDSSCRAAVAVEANPENFRRLQRNADLNGGRFTALNRALYERDGQTVTIRPGAVHHAASEISLDSPSADEGDEIETITLETLMSHLPSAAGEERIIVVKLDVEGVERESMAGAGALLEQDIMVVYEDHYNDPDCENTEFFLKSLEMDVYFISDGGDVRRIDNPVDLATLKTQRGRGYNCVAVKPGSASARIMAATKGD